MQDIVVSLTVREKQPWRDDLAPVRIRTALERNRPILGLASTPLVRLERSLAAAVAAGAAATSLTADTVVVAGPSLQVAFSLDISSPLCL